MQHQKKAGELFKDKNQLLAHEMGTGKTISAISIHKGRKTIIVCPSKLRSNWVTELAKMGQEDVQVVKTGKDTIEGKQWLIVSYGLLGKIIDQVSGIYLYAILDESHFIKGKSDRAKVALRLTRNCKIKTLLTGTPVMNTPIDLWNQLCAIEAGITKVFTKTKFSKRYCGGHLQMQRGRFVYWDRGASHLEELATMIKDDVDIVKKSEVLDLPEKLIISKEIEMDAEEKAEYRRTWADYIDWLKQNPEYTDVQIDKVRSARQLVELGKLRQVTSKIKVNAFLEMLEELGEQQAIVFCEFIDTVDMLNKGLADRKIKYSTLKKEGSIEQFQRKEVQIFTANIIAGGAGLNLQNASNVFIIDESWVPAQNIQAEDRIHRKGQDKQCNIYYLRVLNTIDEYIAKVNINKRKVIDKII